MDEEEKIDEVVSRLKRLLDKQRHIEDRMKKIEEAVEKKGTEE
jgi:DNA anti-recombination protein RmuC